MALITKIRTAIIIMFCILTGGSFFPSALNSMRAGDVTMIGNNHAKAFATEYTDSCCKQIIFSSMQSIPTEKIGGEFYVYNEAKIM